jgi:hypothetical protein
MDKMLRFGSYLSLHAALFLAILCAVALLGGCASLQGTKAQKYAADAVNKYCAAFPYEVRAGVNRPEFAALIAPHKAEIHCYGDPENPRPAP